MCRFIFMPRLAAVHNKKNSRVTEIKMEDGRIFRAKIFIDASYEGDLMASAGVSLFRRARKQFHLCPGDAGRYPRRHAEASISDGSGPLAPRHGDPASGLLPWVQSELPGIEGEERQINSRPTISGYA